MEHIDVPNEYKLGYRFINKIFKIFSYQHNQANNV